MMKNLITVSFVVLICSSCAAPILLTKDSISDTAIVKKQFPNSLHRQVEKLARQLLTTSQSINISGRVAVGTILPTTYSGGSILPPDADFGLQIQESLITFATQAGFTVLEYKTMPDIKFGKQADRMLSRDVDELNTNVSINYYLSGNYTVLENSTMVNIRLIQIPENIVLAAATDYVPNDTMWSESKIRMKQNQIYRKAY